MKQRILIHSCTMVIPFPERIGSGMEVCVADHIVFQGRGVSFCLKSNARGIHRKILAVCSEQTVVVSDRTDRYRCCLPFGENSVDSAYRIGESFQTDEEEGYMIAENVRFLLGV